jgi:signal transduction histidine kinase
LRSLDQNAKGEAKIRPENPNASQEPTERPEITHGGHKLPKPDASAGKLKGQEIRESVTAASHSPPSTADSETLAPGPIRSAVSDLQTLLNPQVSTILSSLVLLLVGVLDYLTGPHISLAIVYLLPVIFAAWFAGKDNGMLVAVVASLVWVSADVATFPPPPNFGVALWNVSSRLAVFAFVVLLLARIRELQAGLEETIARRTHQLELERARGVAMEREVAAVSTREQQRIAHELHDGLGQELGGLAFHAKVLAAKLAAGGVPHSSEAERLVSLLNQSISRTRALSNLLDPVGCESGGLLHALEQLAERAGGVFAIACTFQGPAKLPPISPDAELDLYRVAQEAIHNATQHGHASEVSVQVTLTPCALSLTIIDNGCGFALDLMKNGKDRGMGLRIMRYRASGLGASLEIDSAPGHGCTVRCTLPVNNTEANLTNAH